MNKLWKLYSIILTIIGAFCGGMFIMWKTCMEVLDKEVRKNRIKLSNFY